MKIFEKLSPSHPIELCGEQEESTQLRRFYPAEFLAVIHLIS
jgi:hypothetical protein